MILIDEMVECVVEAIDRARADGATSFPFGTTDVPLEDAEKSLRLLLETQERAVTRRHGGGHRTITTRQALAVWDRRSKHPAGTDGRLLDTVTTALATGVSFGLVRAIWSGQAYRDEVQRYRQRPKGRATA